MSRGVINFTKLRLGHPFSQIQSFDQWAVEPDPFLKSTNAVFPILADVVKVKTGSRSTAHWSNHFIRLSGWLRIIFAQLITPFDIDGIGQNWEDSHTSAKNGNTAIPL